jgi:poly(3-hydroxybutyrate) depolymerase
MPSLSSDVQHAKLRVGDRERSYLAYVPARLPSGAALVIVLHGSDMDGAKMRKTPIEAASAPFYAATPWLTRQSAANPSPPAASRKAG